MRSNGARNTNSETFRQFVNNTILIKNDLFKTEVPDLGVWTLTGCRKINLTGQEVSRGGHGKHFTSDFPLTV